ncbi:protein HEG homolog 1 isoform X2 [Mastomys coucha]|uniref:protein HEG homolog 1 isoform X2 n=1 Tax=Mastomys coucha TaxID=35658 RepID=UPI0012626EEC|nr:protein HEG homolog 1 isoform X2 [Mastomys coucha]
MATPRAPRWPPPSLLLKLLPLLLLLPAAPGARGSLPSPAHRTLLPAAGPLSPPGAGHTVPGPGVSTRRGHSGRFPRGVSAALESLPQSPSSSRSQKGITTSQTKSGTSPGFLERTGELPGEGTVHTQVAGTWVSRQAAFPALEPREPTVLSQKRNSSGQEHPGPPFSWTQSHPPPSDHPSSSRSSMKGNNVPALQNPSVTQTKSMLVTDTFTNGVPRMLRSLPVDVEPASETEGFPEHSSLAITSVSVHSSPSVKDSRTNSGLTERVGDGEGTELSTENGYGLPSIHWQSDAPSFGEHQLANSSEAGNGSAMPLTETVFRSVPSLGGGASTGRWFPAKNKTSTDTAESSASHPGAGSTQSSEAAQQPGGDDSRMGGRSYAESSSSSSTSSSESVDSSAPFGERGEHSTPEDGAVLSDSSDLADSTSGARAPHTSAMFTRSGERTLRSLDLSSIATGPVHPTPRGNVTEHAGLLSGAPTLGVTGLSHTQEHGSDSGQRTSGEHKDHAYVPSSFTKGERTLLSVTDNTSYSETGESSTSSIKISNSPSQAQPKQSSASSHNDNAEPAEPAEPAQSSTESPVLHTSNLPTYTSTVNMPNTLVLDTRPVEDSSDSGASSIPPSPSQPQPFSSALPSTRAPVQQLKSTSETTTSSLSPSPVFLMGSTLAPYSVSQTFPHPSSTLVPHRARETRVTSVQMSTEISAIALVPSNQTADPKNQSTPQQEKPITEAKSPSLVSLPTDSTKAVTVSLPPGTPWSPALIGLSTEPALSATSTSSSQISPALTSAVPQTTNSPVTSPSPLSHVEPLTPDAVVVHTTPEKPHFPTNPEILVPRISTEGAITTEGNREHLEPTTPSIPLTTSTTPAEEMTTELSHAEESSPSHFLTPSSPQTTDVSTAEMLTSRYTTFAAQSTPQSPTTLLPLTPVNSCTVNPCLHDGECLVDLTGRGYRCMCPPAWQGDNCSVDVDECLSSPCPPLATCNNTQGSFTCRCPVGYQLEKGVCNLVRTFVTEFKLRKTFLNTTAENHSNTHELENEMAQTLNVCFSTLPGYIRTTARVFREPSTVVISLQATFALVSNVTLFDLADRIQKYVNSCRSSAEVCQLLGSQRRVFRAGSLCKRKSPECDKETSICTDLDGVALCQCKSGYFQFNKMDHSCRACEDGYRLENETCMSCPFGLGGLNCGNPYQLITVVIAAAGGGLLLILGIALIVTCCRKSKNDISKLIFKSGDFQMSPYAEYPKNPRSQEWGREAIEMHENGSTKNLLQMTDVYYSPTNVRNPELERNGLYPAYTGLPGSRHSCIFPGQYNPSFISDESRRRDYF